MRANARHVLQTGSGENSTLGGRCAHPEEKNHHRVRIRYSSRIPLLCAVALYSSLSLRLYAFFGYRFFCLRTRANPPPSPQFEFSHSPFQRTHKTDIEKQAHPAQRSFACGWSVPKRILLCKRRLRGRNGLHTRASRTMPSCLPAMPAGKKRGSALPAKTGRSVKNKKRRRALWQEHSSA